MNTTCTARKIDGTPCRANAVCGAPSAIPPRCAAHGGVVPDAVAAPDRDRTLPDVAHPDPEAESLREDIQTIICDLAAKQFILSGCINDHFTKLHIPALIHLLRLHADIAGRLGHLLRDQRALSGGASDGIAAAIAQALDELSTELGVPL